MTASIFTKSCYPTSPLGVATTHSETGTTRTYAQSQFVYLSCDQPPGAFIVEQGLVRVGISTEDGEEITTAVLKTGDLFGSLLAHGHPREEFAQTLTTVRLRAIDLTTLYRLLSERPTFAREFLGLLEHRFQQLEQHFVMMNARQAQERLVAFLRFLAEHHGRYRDNAVVIDNFLTHNNLAQIINTTRQTVSSCLVSLEETEALRYSRRQIILLPAFSGYHSLVQRLELQ